MKGILQQKKIRVRRYFVVVRHRSSSIPTISAVQFSAVDVQEHVVVSSIVVLLPTTNEFMSWISFSKQTCRLASSACCNNSSLNGANFGILISFGFFSKYFEKNEQELEMSDLLLNSGCFRVSRRIFLLWARTFLAILYRCAQETRLLFLAKYTLESKGVYQSDLTHWS